MQHAPPASGGMFHLEAFDENGVKVWEDVAFNKVVDGALGLFLNPLFNIARPTTQYLGLTNASPTIAAGDTMASHAGWTENQTYTEGTRQVWNKVLSGTGSLNNSASQATYSINGSTTVGGVFLVSGNNTKGGTAGDLHAVAALNGGNATLQSGWTLRITYTLTLTSAA